MADEEKKRKEKEKAEKAEIRKRKKKEREAKKQKKAEERMAHVMKKTPEWYCPHCLLSHGSRGIWVECEAANCSTTHDVLAMRGGVRKT